MTLYDKIKSMADDQNLSISYIEENAQLSNGSISKWKVNSPRADSLYKVAKFLGCSVEFLMSEYNDEQVFSDNYSGSMIGESSQNHRYSLNENEIEILNILKKFKTYRNQIQFIARVELLANEMLSNIEDNEQRD